MKDDDVLFIFNRLSLKGVTINEHFIEPSGWLKVRFEEMEA